MRSDLVVLPEPNIDSDLGLFGGVEPFSVEPGTHKIKLSAKNSGAFIAARSIYYSICSWATQVAI